MRKTRHFQERMQQRGVRESDVELILQIGTTVEGGLLVRNKDAQREIAKLMAKIERLKRLQGQLIIQQGNRLITTYKATLRRQKIALRGSRGRRTYRRT